MENDTVIHRSCGRPTVRGTWIQLTLHLSLDAVASVRQLLVSAKHNSSIHGHRLYGHVVQHHQRTSSQQFYNLLYNKFTTNGQKFATSLHVKILGSGSAMWQICCTSCRTVVSSSVGGVVQHVRIRCPCSGVLHLTRVMGLCTAAY